MTVRNTQQYLVATTLPSALIAVLLLITLSPVLLLLALLVRQDGGPVLYAPARIGKGGKAFKCFKFRTMHVDAEKITTRMLKTLTEQEYLHWRETRKLPNDPRITKIGRLLRKFSLDELPQILNIARGEMAFFGPRPVLQEEMDEMYGKNARYYNLCRPGLSGLAQIRVYEEAGLLPYKRRVALDRLYAMHSGPILDCAIALRTLILLFKARNY